MITHRILIFLSVYSAVPNAQAVVFQFKVSGLTEGYAFVNFAVLIIEADPRGRWGGVSEECKRF